MFCALGAWALQRRKRTLVVFSFFVTGFAFTLIFAPLGFAFIFWADGSCCGPTAFRSSVRPTPKWPPRRQRTARRAAERKKAASTTSKPTAYKPPTANKRYTPKAAPRKKVAKPTEKVAEARRVGQAWGATPSCSPPGMTRAERRRASTSLRLRTNERAVGSSPKARRTSTSVTMPITVE